jgi:glutamate--cysteine ligase
MSTKEVSDRVDPFITTREQLIAPMAKGEKPRDRWRIGTEHEKLVYRTADHRAPSYEEEHGIRDLLKSLEQFGWEPIMEGGNVIAMKGADGNISLEPAGQLELSGAPLVNLHETCAESARHVRQVKPSASDRHRLHGPWPVARQDARRIAHHAQGPL